MAFSPSNRVLVSNQQSQYRNHLGTVTVVGAGSGFNQQVLVRIDGHEAAGEILFTDGDLRPSTLPCPIQY